MRDKLSTFLTDLKLLRAKLKSESAKTVAKNYIRNLAEELATRWLNELLPALQGHGFQAEKLDLYTEQFRTLLKLSAPNNLRSRYIEVLSAVIKPMRDELVLPLHEHQSESASLALLNKMFQNLPAAENAYLAEAVGCAQRNYLRAAVVMGWCAAIDRLHRKIEEIGFSAFNLTSSQMASQQKGRFKKFNQVQNVSTISELREVFDNIILWIIEGMQLIDSNQHTRLHSCFEMRCHSAHPGEAPITDYNLLSFFSDLEQIVFHNPKFALAA